ncbi:anthrax toxin receptor-like isoform X2 [Hippopotamus amphibius kiboko]|nr:anthrax toxin receptor-like isoform X2 [Hippopotamus amphibius kiboko]
MDVYGLVEDLIKKFDNPNLRISFITYSTLGRTVMKLTSDKNEIREGLRRLQNVVPTGATNMQEGFKKANEQIQQATSGGNKIPSLIISLTDGTLEEAPFEMTKDEADKARKMGATVYCVGVKDFDKEQLLEIADSPNHVFGVDQGFKALKYVVEPLGTKSCMEITIVEPSSICTADEYELMISGKGFNNAKKKEEVICRFKFSDKQFFDKKANSVKDTSITCPGVRIEKPDQEVFVEVSLNNGISFITNNVSITSKNCVNTREEGLNEDAPPAAPPDAPSDPPPAAPSASPPAALPAAQQPPEVPLSPPQPQFLPYVNPLYFFALIPALLLFLLMFWCIWWLCRRKTFKEPPPVQKPEREPEETCQMPCPTVIVPCGCQGGGMKRMEGKLDTLCDFVQRCNQMSLMWCPPRDMGKCLNLALTKPHCGQLHCSPKICLQPSHECFSINSCCSRYQHSPLMCSRPPSRMHRLVSPPAQPLCGATLSLQPP